MFIFYVIIVGILGFFGILTFLSKKRNHISPVEMADIIERFIERKSAEWEWDDFISSPINDPSLDKIRIHCSQLHNEYPSTKSGEYTNEKGLEILRQYIQQLRTSKEVII